MYTDREDGSPGIVAAVGGREHRTGRQKRQAEERGYSFAATIWFGMSEQKD